MEKLKMTEIIARPEMTNQVEKVANDEREISVASVEDLG